MGNQVGRGADKSDAAFDAVIVGAGFSGLYALYRLRNDLGLRVRVLEAGSGVGGTWYWNRYPGCRCDVPSAHYSFSFSKELDQEWHWTEKCSAQPEIERYLNHVADRFDLRRDIDLNSRVVSARFDEASQRWEIGTADGKQLRARFFISAAGILSTGYVPPFKGLEQFRGRRFFSGEWPKEPVDFKGRRVAVIGTGSTGIQIIPIVAREAARLTVFQRTANYSIPTRNVPTDPERERALKANYPEVRKRERVNPLGLPDDLSTRSALGVSPEERQRIYERAWATGGFSMLVDTFYDLMLNRESNRTISDFIASKIREKVRDPHVAAMLVPTHPFGTKRPALDTEYFETFNRDNVELVDVRNTPIEAITPGGVRTSEAEFEVDDIIFATGFDAFTGTLFRMNIRGRGGRRLEDHWADGPRTVLGFGAHHFPNFFMIIGPQSGVYFNVARNIEQHVDWVADCIRTMLEKGCDTVEPTTAGEERWGEQVRAAAAASLVPETDSWWVGSNIPGKPRVILRYIGGAVEYQRACAAEAAGGYQSFAFGTTEAATAA